MYARHVPQSWVWIVKAPCNYERGRSCKAILTLPDSGAKSMGQTSSAINGTNI